MSTTPATSTASKHHVTHEKKLLGTMASHFCNPEVSDVTLVVANCKYPAHRFVLAIQSPVFSMMLTGDKWKEANETLVQLEEHPNCELIFGDFLRFFYTAKIELNCQNVCALHMLSDKYNVATLNNDCVDFMKSVLDGSHENILMTALLWISYLDKGVPQLLPNCIAAIQSNFQDLKDINIPLNWLSVKHMKAILGDSNGSKLVVSNELQLYLVVQKWILQIGNPELIQEILPLIRFYNMDANEIEGVKKSVLGQMYTNNLFKEHLSHAYQLQAEMFAFSVTAPKKRKLSGGGVEHKCKCKSSGQCQHVNPRLYLCKPFGKKMRCKLGIISRTSFGIVDLSSLKSYMKIFTGQDKAERWKIRWAPNTTPDNLIKEHFTLSPAACHYGRLFTLAVSVKYIDTKYSFSYNIVHSGTVSFFDFTVCSPGRIKDLELKEFARFNVAVYLHKSQ